MAVEEVYQADFEFVQAGFQADFGPDEAIQYQERRGWNRCWL